MTHREPSIRSAFFTGLVLIGSGVVMLSHPPYTLFQMITSVFAVAVGIYAVVRRIAALHDRAHRKFFLVTLAIVGTVTILMSLPIRRP